MKKDRVQKPFALGERSPDFLLATADPPKPEEIAKPPAAASQVDSNAPSLKEVGSGRHLYALYKAQKITLIDAKTFTPLAEVAEKTVKDSAEGYRYFEGNGPDKRLYDLAVEMKGDEICR